MPENQQLQLVFNSAHKFRQGQLDIVGLQQNLSLVLAGLTGEVPTPVQRAIYRAEAEVDSIRFTVARNRQAEAVEEVLHDLEEVISRFTAPLG
jgi:hypothetical protein